MTRRVLLLFFMISIGVRAAAADMGAHETAIRSCFSRGDYNGLAVALESMITEHPLEPLSVLHYGTLFRMKELIGPGRVEKTARGIIDSIRNKKDDNARSCLLQLDCELEKMLYRINSGQGKAITGILKPVRKWMLYGPYRRYGTADMDYQFQPEVLSSGREVSPQKRITITASDGWLDPGKYIFPDHGIVYASVSFRIRIPVKLRIYSGSSYKVFINGRETARNVLQSRRNRRVLRVRACRGITVMVKMSGSPFEKLRMLVTDEHNTIIEPEIVPENFIADECDVTDDPDYPHDMLTAGVAVNSEKADEQLGLYFDALESREAIDYYRKSAAKKNNEYISFFLASALLKNYSGDRGSAGYNEGLGIINDLRGKYPDFAPAWQKKIEHLAGMGDLQEAYREGRNMLSRIPGNPFSFELYTRVLNALGYEKETEETIDLVKNRFPYFIPIMEAEAHYYKKRDRGRFIKKYLELIQRDFSVTRVRSILREYISRGDYQPAQNLIRAYNFNNEFNKELIEIFIKKGDYKAARDLIFNNLIVQESPYLYYALGLIDMLQAEDPSMYLQKLLRIQPSLFPVSDYALYLENEGLANPFGRLLDRVESIGPLTFNKEYSRFPSAVLYRGRIFLLQNDGSSRVYCEDIIYVGNEEGIRRWGDIKVPYRGRINPVHLKVYDENGPATDSYAVHKARDDSYININSLKKNSIIHLSYIVDNPVIAPEESRMFSLPLEFLQHYDEPVQKASIKVISPEGVKVNFLFRDRVPVKITSSEGLRLHEAVMENIPAVRNEPFSGGRQNCLHYYSFSTMEGIADFTAWYQGLLAQKSADHRMPVERFRKDTLEKTIAGVYDFVAREIELQRNVLYYPDSADNTLFRKSGTVEDKVLLAQDLLRRLDIRSYVAFARNRFLPGGRTDVYPEYFTHILLFVPLDLDNAIWLDFSSRYFRCGVTAGVISGSDAVVLIHDSYRLGRVRSLDARSTVSRYDIVIGNDGNAVCNAETAFIDSKGDIRSFFRNALYREESVQRYFSSMLPGFSPDSYRVENYKECDRPFVIAARGAGFGIAISDSRKIILQPVLNKCEIYDYVAMPERIHPLVVENVIDEKEIYRYTLPALYEKQEITRTRVLKNRFGSCTIVIKKKEIHIDAMVIRPIDYNEFVNFCLELKRIENDTIILEHGGRLNKQR